MLGGGLWKRVALLAGGALMGAAIVATPIGAAEPDELWAVVNADGTLGRGSGAALVDGGLGTYRVYFTRYVVDCAYTATIGLPGSEGNALPGFITVAGADRSARVGVYWEEGVIVNTYGPTGTLSARSFHLRVDC